VRRDRVYSDNFWPVGVQKRGELERGAVRNHHPIAPILFQVTFDIRRCEYEGAIAIGGKQPISDVVEWYRLDKECPSQSKTGLGLGVLFKLRRRPHIIDLKSPHKIRIRSLNDFPFNGRVALPILVRRQTVRVLIAMYYAPIHT